MWVIKWTPEAEEQFYNILEYWNEHNGSNTYSQKIYLEVQKAQDLLSYNPYIDQEYELNSEIKIRKHIILKNFSIIYRITDIVEILSFWDNRQNPKKLEDFFKV